MESQYEKFMDLSIQLAYNMGRILGSVTGKQTEYSEDGSPIATKDIIRSFEEYIDDWSQLDFYTEGLFKELLHIDHIARQAVFRMCCKGLDIEFIARWIRNYDILCERVDDYYINRSFWLYLSLYSELHDIASLFDITIIDVYSLRSVEDFIFEQGHRREYRFTKELVNKTQQDDNNNKKYTSLPRTHRIAAVWGLIDKLGLRRSKDKTTLAAFVEAVTGGNIDAQPQDTVSYKKLESSAQEAAAKWLKKIGIE